MDFQQGRPVSITVGETTLQGDLAVPLDAHGAVLFAHGSGSSRVSPRNRYVAATLQAAGFATLLIDLLTRAEEDVDARTGHLRFDVELLAERLARATDWIDQVFTRGIRSVVPYSAGLNFGYEIRSARTTSRSV